MNLVLGIICIMLDQYNIRDPSLMLTSNLQRIKQCISKRLIVSSACKHLLMVWAFWRWKSQLLARLRRAAHCSAVQQSVMVEQCGPTFTDAFFHAWGTIWDTEMAGFGKAWKPHRAPYFQTRFDQRICLPSLYFLLCQMCLFFKRV